MTKHNVTKKNFNQVLDNIKRDFRMADNECQRQWINRINQMLNDLLSEDFFGAEGEGDPRKR